MTKIVTEEGGKYPFTGEPPTNLPSAKTEMDITKVGLEEHAPNDPQDTYGGHDTYEGIPGDGIVPG